MPPRWWYAIATASMASAITGWSRRSAVALSTPPCFLAASSSVFMIAREPSPAPSIDRQDFESGLLGRPVYRLTLPPLPRSSTLAGPLAVLRERLTREGVGLVACRIE